MNKHEDERGVIEDLKVGKDWSVTYISFKKGAVRGNHYHKKTEQVDYILSGKVICADGNGYERVVKAGEYEVHNPGLSHAYQALEDSEMVSMCKGVRIGENYEEDTFRLKEKLL